MHRTKGTFYLVAHLTYCNVDTLLSFCNFILRLTQLEQTPEKRFSNLLTVEQTAKNKAFELTGYRLKAATIFCGNPRQSTALFSVGDRR